jgi:hypothetical protein
MEPAPLTHSVENRIPPKRRTTAFRQSQACPYGGCEAAWFLRAVIVVTPAKFYARARDNLGRELAHRHSDRNRGIRLQKNVETSLQFRIFPTNSCTRSRTHREPFKGQHSTRSSRTDGAMTADRSQSPTRERPVWQDRLRRRAICPGATRCHGWHRPARSVPPSFPLNTVRPDFNSAASAVPPRARRG